MGLEEIFSKGGKDAIKALLKAYGLKTEKSYLLEPRGIRASVLSKACVRAVVLHERLKVKLTAEESASLRLAYAHGHGLHHAMQNIVFPEMGILRGRWRCKKPDCGKVYGNCVEGQKEIDAAVRRPESCVACGTSSGFDYDEYDLYDKEYKLSAHCDGFIAIPGRPGLGVVELKTTALGWKVKTGPFPEHMRQLQIYLWLTGAQWGEILYWDKQSDEPNKFAEHFVVRDEAEISKLKLMLLSLWEALDGGALPERVCRSPDCAQAEKCPVVEACFQDWKREADCAVGLF